MRIDLALDVVHRGFLLPFKLLHLNKGCEGVTAENLADRPAEPVPDVSGDANVRLVAHGCVPDAVYEGAGAFQYRDDIEYRYLVGCAVQKVAALSAALRLYDAALMQRGKDMFEVFFADPLPFRNIGKENRAAVRTACRQVDKRPQAIPPLG